MAAICEQPHVGKVIATDGAFLGGGAAASTPREAAPELLGQRQDFQEAHAQGRHLQMSGGGHPHWGHHGHRQHQGGQLL